MDKVITWKEVKRMERKAKFDKFVEDSKQKVKDGAKRAWDNKEGVMAVIATGTTIVGKAVKVANNYRKNHEIYDPSLHKNVKLKKQISRNMQRTINERYSNGETLHDIYSDMGII